MNPSKILARHLALDDAIRDNPALDFVSDWNGTHPYAEEFIPRTIREECFPPDLGRYYFADAEANLRSQISRMHTVCDKTDVSSDQVIAGEGSSSFIAAFSLWLAQGGTREVFYLPPLYYTFHYFLRLLGIRTRPISGRQAFEAGFSLNLPAQRCTLLLCDPMWYAGRKLDEASILKIAKWQRATGSTVFVDGSFQYMQWGESRFERTSQLDHGHTYRLICPMKALGVPAFRFSYLLLPARDRAKFLFLYESLLGSTSWPNLVVASRAIQVMNSAESNRRLTDYLKRTYDSLVRKKKIETTISPDCGYFVFAKIKKGRLQVLGRDYLGMTEDYFELKRYPGYVRLNLFDAGRVLSSK